MPGNAKALVKFLGKDERYQLLGSENRGKLKVFQLRDTIIPIRIKNDENTAFISMKDGRKQKWEIPYGSSFLSQSSRFIKIPKQVKTVTISTYTGKSRTINF